MFYKWPKYIVVFFSVLMMCLPGFSIQAQTVKHIVVIDPAHGGEEAGSIGIDKIAEKDLTLAIALALQKELARESNMEVFLTRDSDKTLSLDERKKNITKIKPAMVLSLHINAGFGRTSSGFELYYPGFENVNVPRKGGKGAVVGAENQHLNDTVKLARLVQKNLDGLFPRKSRGLREAGVPLAEGLSVPVLVVELGFATNPDDKKKLASDKTQKEIARALAKSIQSFFQEPHVQKKSE
ncbi:MAG: N-acetylmuramoyl-L-alanine amidase [Smithellaceae bacterium]|nr:N-acetylmuramoyl-L-alanine amidase [Smithellaceae bacterium]